MHEDWLVGVLVAEYFDERLEIQIEAEVDRQLVAQRMEWCDL